MPADSFTLYYADGTCGVQSSRLIFLRPPRVPKDPGAAADAKHGMTSRHHLQAKSALRYALPAIPGSGNAKGRYDRYACGECRPRCAALIVTRDLAGVATSRLAMSDGRQSALAGTLIGPSLQASQTPETSAAPAREWTIRRHRTLSGSPRRLSWMLVPHEVAVRAAVALTRMAGFAPDSVTVAGRGAVPVGASQNPPAAPAPATAATDAARAATRHRPCGRPVAASSPLPSGRRSLGTPASRPGNGARTISSARHAGQPGRCASTRARSPASAAPRT